MSDYIGKTISLIGQDELRYVGKLEAISAETSTVSLRNVTSYGTEGRRNGVNEVPPSSEPLASISFKGSDVKDLQVLAQDKPDSAEPVEKQPQTTDETSSPYTDLDFVARTAKLAGSDKAQDVTIGYSKSSSFFDNLSSGQDSHSRYREHERQLNMETFGEAGATYRGRGRGRGGRGGRGHGRGYGRGYGRGRGGNHSEHRDQEHSSTGEHSNGADRGHRGNNNNHRGRGNGNGNGRGNSEGGRGRGRKNFFEDS